MLAELTSHRRRDPGPTRRNPPPQIDATRRPAAAGTAQLRSELGTQASADTGPSGPPDTRVRCAVRGNGAIDCDPGPEVRDDVLTHRRLQHGRVSGTNGRNHERLPRTRNI